jgi:hypothetical protein
VEHLIQAIKNKIKNYKEDLGKNLLSKGVDDIQEFKRVHGMGQGLDKSLEIINEMVEKYKKRDIDND